MTPAVTLLKKKRINYQLHEYEHDSAHESYGLEAAEKMGVPSPQVFKTLVLVLEDKSLAVGVLPVSSMLSMKQMAKAVSAKKATMAEALMVERSTGYVLGGVSPLGQKKRLQTVIDSSAEAYKTIYVSAGRRGLEIEISPKDLCGLLNGRFADIKQ